SNRGGRFTFGRNGIVSIPSRASTPTLAGSFIAQGAPIPVTQAGFAAITLTPKKMGVMTTMTREISEHSTPAIEQLLRLALDQAVLHMEDTTPLAIGTVGAPNTVAAPVRSLWQTDSIGIRMLLDINWAIVRTAVVSVRTAVSW